MWELSGQASGALATAFVITVLELAEVVAIVYALGAASQSLRPGLLGAISGVGVVGAIGVGVGVALTRVPVVYSLAVGTVLLWAFAAFLLRSTFRTYVRSDRQRRNLAAGFAKHDMTEGALTPAQLFAAGVSVGSIEALEAVIVLLGISAGGFPWEAVLGALAAGAVLVALGLALHESIRRLKVPPLKWVTTSLLATYATFWALELLGEGDVIPFPSSVGGLPNDVLLIPLFFAALLVVRGLVQLRLLLDRRPPAAPLAAQKPH